MTSAQRTSTRSATPSGGGVRRGDGCGERVAVDAEDAPGRRAGQGHQVAADPAAQVGHPVRGQRREPLRVPGGDRGPGRLLQAVRGEPHPVGGRTELAPGPGPQPGLGERGGREPVVDAGAAQLLGRRQGPLLVVRRDPSEQRGTLRREQRLERRDLGVRVHRAIIASRG